MKYMCLKIVYIIEVRYCTCSVLVLRAFNNYMHLYCLRKWVLNFTIIFVYNCDSVFVVCFLCRGLYLGFLIFILIYPFVTVNS